MKKVVILLCITLSGCAFREGWTRPDTTQAERKADLYACERDMWMTGASAKLFRQCMDARGYTKAN